MLQAASTNEEKFFCFQLLKLFLKKSVNKTQAFPFHPTT